MQMLLHFYNVSICENFKQYRTFNKKIKTKAINTCTCNKHSAVISPLSTQQFDKVDIYRHVDCAVPKGYKRHFSLFYGL